MATKRNTIRTRTPFKRPIKNPVSNEPISDKIYNVMDNSRKLSELKIIPKTEGEPLQDSLSVLAAFGITVVQQNQGVDTSLLSDSFLDTEKLEKLKPTQDNNPNRLQPDKFKNLRNRKVPVSEIFNQTEPSPINDLDSCQPNETTVPQPDFSNVIEVANDFINFSDVPLAKRIVLK
jgi:hypothetical protein